MYKSKEKIRKEILEKRQNLTREYIDINSDIIQDKVINDIDFQKAKNVLIYIEYKNEVKTKKIIEYSLKTKKKVFIPRVENEYMNFYEFSSYAELDFGYKGILEPKDKNVLKNFSCDDSIVIVPCVAINKEKNRIGYGKGFYDKFLGKYPLKSISIAFDIQLSNDFESEAHDITMNKIYTQSFNI